MAPLSHSLELPATDDHALLAAIIDHAPDAILVCDEAGRVVLANQEAGALFVLTPNELVGRSIDSFIPERMRTAHRHHRERFNERPERRPMGRDRRLPALRADGTEVMTEIALSHASVGGKRYAIVTLRDMSARIAEEERLRYLGTHDSLTDLYNRAFFEAEKERLERGRVAPISVIVIDIDNLKLINDAHGHAAGDQHLRRLAAVLRQSFRAEDVVARLGGDEFVVLLPATDSEQCASAIERFTEDLRRHNEIAPRPVEVSIGASTTRRPEALSTAIRLADERMYDRKRRGRRISSVS